MPSGFPCRLPLVQAGLGTHAAYGFCTFFLVSGEYFAFYTRFFVLDY